MGNVIKIYEDLDEPDFRENELIKTPANQNDSQSDGFVEAQKFAFVKKNQGEKQFTNLESNIKPINGNKIDTYGHQNDEDINEQHFREIREKSIGEPDDVLVIEEFCLVEENKLFEDIDLIKQDTNNNFTQEIADTTDITSRKQKEKNIKDQEKKEMERLKKENKEKLKKEKKERELR